MWKKSEIKKALGAGFDLKNVKDVKINGNTVGCSGFIGTARGLVYINTDGGICGNKGQAFIYRTATGLRDYAGGANQWFKPKMDEKNPLDGLAERINGAHKLTKCDWL
jgi:hypothetical protein